MLPSSSRLRKHADFQRVYKGSRKHFTKHLSYFYLFREGAADLCPSKSADTDGPRFGLTVGKAMGKAVDRNRIKRRLREAIRGQLPPLPDLVDVVLHPRREVADLDFPLLEREVASVFRAIQKAHDRRLEKPLTTAGNG